MSAVVTGRFSVMTNQQAQFTAARLKQGALFDWNGGSRGIQTTILFEPGRDITVIVLTNSSNAGTSSHDIAKQLLTAARSPHQSNAIDRSLHKFLAQASSLPSQNSQAGSLRYPKIL